MKEEKATAVMFVLVALAGLCLCLAIGLEIWDAIRPDNVKRVERLLNSAGSMKYLLDKTPFQQWVVASFGAFLTFTGLATLTWVYHRKL